MQGRLPPEATGDPLKDCLRMNWTLHGAALLRCPVQLLTGPRCLHGMPTGLLPISALTILAIEPRCDLRVLFHAAWF